MRQIVIIHGGDSFPSYAAYKDNLMATSVEYERLKPKRRWRDTVIESFPDADVLTPTMPNSANAQYDEWVIWFEKIIPFFRDDVSLVGHSLGAMFLVKYLHTTPLPSPVRQLLLLAGGYDYPTQEYGSFRIDSATGVQKSARTIHLFHSKDDFVVPFSELAKLHADLPSALVHTFEDRNHFLGGTFPELIEVLQQK